MCDITGLNHEALEAAQTTCGSCDDCKLKPGGNKANVGRKETEKQK